MRISIILIPLLFIGSAGYSATIYVPKDYPEIQQAINAAAKGDTVLVDPGTYVENIDFLGKAITVTSSKGAMVTVIDGSNPVNPDYGSVATFHNGEGGNSILEGFTLMNGMGGKGPSMAVLGGGGILCEYSSPTIRNNIITNNKLSFDITYGGGIFCWNASPVVRSNVIAYNEAYRGGGISGVNSYARVSGNEIFMNESFSGGGGIHCDGSGMSIVDNSIVDNESFDCGGGIWSTGIISIEKNVVEGNQALYGSGGGIHCLGWSNSATVLGNVISGNFCQDNGGGVRCEGGSGHLTNNLIFGNKAIFKGGGVDCYSTSVTMTNNVVYDNVSEKGGGIRLGADTRGTIVNTIIWNNASTYGGDLRVGGESQLQISYCDYDGKIYVAPNAVLIQGPGMIDADPLFIDPMVGDYHLRYTSPCRDAGDDAAVGLPWEDFEGDPRIAGAHADMGADEFYTHLYFTGDANPGGNIEVKIIDIPGTAPLVLWAGSGVLDPPLSTKYGEWFLKLPLVFELNLGGMTSPEGFVSLPVTLPPDIPTPWDIPLQALSGSNLTNLSVIAVN